MTTEEELIQQVELQRQQQLPPIKIAFVLDGEVVDILHTDERLAAIFTSNPLIIDVTEILKEQGTKLNVGTKWDYDSEQFVFEE